MLDSINASTIALSLYNGDTKDGGSICNGDVFAIVQAMFNGMKNLWFMRPDTKSGSTVTAPEMAATTM